MAPVALSCSLRMCLPVTVGRTSAFTGLSPRTLAASAGAWAGCVSVAACTGRVVKERHRPASGEGLAAWVREASAGYTAEKAAAGGGVKGLCGGFAGRSVLLYSLQREGQELRGQQFPQQAVPVAASPMGCGTRSSIQSIPSQAGFFLYVLNVFSVRRKIN